MRFLKFSKNSLILNAALMGGMWCASGLAYGSAGDHIRVGDTTITPAVGFSTDVDSNATQAASDPTAGVSVLVRPTLTVENDGASTSVNVFGQYDARKFFGQNLQQLDRIRDFKLMGDVEAMKNNTVGLQLTQALQMLSDPNDSAAGYQFAGSNTRVIFEDASAYNTRLANRTDADVTVRFGPTLLLKVGGDFQYDDYRSPVGEQYSLESTNRRTGVGPSGELAWTFFPRTAFVLSYNYTAYRWANNTLDASGDGGGLGEYVIIPNSTHSKFEAGLRGRLTERLVVVVMGGVGGANYDSESSSIGAVGAEADAAAVGFDADLKGLDKLLLSSQVRYRVGASQTVGLTYLKNFTDVFFTNFASFHDVGVKWDGEFGERLSAGAVASVRLEDYKGEVSRQDQRIRVGAMSNLKLANWSSLAWSVSYLQRASDVSASSFADVSSRLSFNVTY